MKESINDIQEKRVTEREVGWRREGVGGEGRGLFV